MIRDKKLTGALSGFTELDNLTDGWEPSSLYVIAARPSMGKTSFVLSTAYNVAKKQEKSVAYFSLESGGWQIAQRIRNMYPEEKFININFDAPKRSRTPEMAFKDIPLFIDDTPALSIEEFRKKAHELKLNHNVSLIIIDYLELMTGTRQQAFNSVVEIESIICSLKSIAVELNLPIIITAQLPRPLNNAGRIRRPSISDIKVDKLDDTADVLAFIYRPEYYGIYTDQNQISIGEIAEIIVVKNGAREIGTAKLCFHKEFAKFSNINGSK